LIQDYEELAKMKFIGNVDASRLNKPLSSLEPMERLPLLESMLFGLRPRERRQKRHAAFGSEMLRLYFGYRDAFRLLADLASPDIKHITQSRAFIDTLASHSSGIGESSGIEQTKWEIANFSTGGVLVVTRETSYTTPIRIGQIAAFISGKEMKRPLVGYVTRLHRPNEQNIEVAVGCCTAVQPCRGGDRERRYRQIGRTAAGCDSVSKSGFTLVPYRRP
jgi:hypothetical protein